MLRYDRKRSETLAITTANIAKASHRCRRISAFNSAMSAFVAKMPKCLKAC